MNFTNITVTKPFKLLQRKKYPDFMEVSKYIDDISEVTALRRRAVADGNLVEADRYTTMIEVMQCVVIELHSGTLGYEKGRE